MLYSLFEEYWKHLYLRVLNILDVLLLYALFDCPFPIKYIYYYFFGQFGTSLWSSKDFFGA